eukprot:5067343-Heterocapsa_arctica.AAC.1
MHDDGITRVVNVDISGVVVDRMAAAHADCTEMQWLVLDVTDMSRFGDETFDLVVDKGMFDTLASPGGSCL